MIFSSSAVDQLMNFSPKFLGFFCFAVEHVVMFSIIVLMRWMKSCRATFIFFELQMVVARESKGTRGNRRARWTRYSFFWKKFDSDRLRPFRPFSETRDQNLFSFRPLLQPMHCIFRPWFEGFVGFTAKRPPSTRQWQTHRIFASKLFLTPTFIPAMSESILKFFLLLCLCL